MRYLMALVAFIALGADELKWENLNHNQRATALAIYALAKPYKYEMTMIAIAWQESRLGKVPINLQDPSCGVHHIQVVNFLSLKGIKDTSLNRNIYCNELINEIGLSTATAIEIFLAFKAFHKGDYSKAIRSYNGGYNFAKTEAMAYQTSRYYKEVYHNVKYLESIRASVFEGGDKTDNNIDKSNNNLSKMAIFKR